MGQLSFSNVSEAASARLLDFLNRAYSAKDILNLRLIKEGEEGTTDYGIGRTVAGRLISRKRGLPGRRYTDLSQLNGVQGFGQDKFDDLVSTFSISSAERFKRNLFEQQILFENWEVRYHSVVFDTEAAFRDATKDALSICKVVQDNIHEIADDNPDHLIKVKDQIAHAYFQTYQEGFLGSYEFALWFFKFDQDNWFSFERIREPLEAYLSEVDSNAYDAIQFYKGVENYLLLNGITVTDLPVVIMEAERSITFWTAALFD
ncbi:MAG: hypothetical protein AAFR59_01350 [Bacteroidota bacterium]